MVLFTVIIAYLSLINNDIGHIFMCLVVSLDTFFCDTPIFIELTIFSF